MEVILKQDITGLGYKNDTIKVKGGYGRNYLIPQGFAIVASHSNRKMIAENIKQAAHKADKIKNDAETLAAKLAEVTLQIGAKAGEQGKIFGAITTHQISEALKNEGFVIDRKKIAFKSQVKTLGEYEAIADLHREVKQDIKFTVVEE
ncbi:MAG: 50S ribosomal protein L9 [Bacteroidetes bacterium]|nr:50S ribosomal protein L9 [Bacteroidota bacterium]MCH8234163.1 50S ribosomal protein L9 [Bacteroidota bacterium]